MEYWVGYLDQALIFGVLAVSLNILVGYAGIFSIGSAAFAAIGGYTTAVLTVSSGWPPVAAVGVSMLLGGAAGFLITAPILRLAEEYVMLMTMSLSILLVTVIIAVPALGSQTGILGIPAPVILGTALLKPSDFLPWLLIVLALVTAVCWRLGESPFGRLLRASRDNLLGVRSLGKNPFPARLFIFAAMCAFTALGGALLVLYNGIAAASLFSVDQTMLIFAMVIVGGICSVPGSLVGALLIVGLTPLLSKGLQIAPEDSALIQPIVFGVVLVLIMRFRPAGIIRERHSPPRIDGSVQVATTELMTVKERHDVGGSPPLLAAGARDRVLLDVRSLSKSFGGVVAVRDLSLQLRKNEITALIGPNGAGKSTVFNLLTGAVAPDAGAVQFNNADITGMSPERIARLGMVRSFQDLRIFPRLTALENVMMAGQRHPGDNPLALLAKAGSVRRRDRQLAQESAQWLEFVGLDPSSRGYVESLSFAAQKQVAFARVLATKAEVLLLDEPLSGIEAGAVDELLILIERMRDAGHTICIVEHSVQAISRLADWAYFMESGHVTAEGRVSDLLADNRLKGAYFGVA